MAETIIMNTYMFLLHVWVNAQQPFTNWFKFNALKNMLMWSNHLPPQLLWPHLELGLGTVPLQLKHKSDANN